MAKLLLALFVCLHTLGFLPGAESLALRSTAKVRTIHIAAVEIEWDYAPSGIDSCNGKPFTSDQPWVATGPGYIGHKYRKAVYREFDAGFTSQRSLAPQWEHLGILGPVIHAEVGDEIHITFRNTLDFAVNMHPDSYFMQDLDNPNPADEVPPPIPVEPGQTVVYRWKVQPEAGPASLDSDSTMITYRSTVDTVGHLYAGLVGPIIITAAGKADAQGRPLSVVYELVNMFFVLNENKSPFLEKNIELYNSAPDSLDPAAFEESNLMHSINGYVFCNLNGLNTTVNSRTRVYLISEGTEVDLHTPHFHANVLTTSTSSADVFNLLPSVVMVANMVPDNAGSWLYHCHVNDHIIAGMVAIYHVAGPLIIPAVGGVERVYYIAADEVDWNYVPNGINSCKSRPFNDQESAYTTRPIYKKLQYREYTDGTFSELKPRPAKERHLGLVGPTVRAEVGDVIVIHFKNNARFPVSVHPHGVFYEKNSEGAPYQDGTNQHGDDSVATGSYWTYRWYVPERTGPLHGNMSTMLWMYHSHVDETGDTNAGLIGYMVITKKGMGRSPTDPSPKDVDDEIFALFTIFNEKSSILRDVNGVDPEAADADTHVKRTINGYMFCNGYPFVAGVDRRTRWYVSTLGTEADLHSVTWDQLTGEFEGHRRDVVGLLPAAMAVVNMQPKFCISKYLHCQVQDHVENGMIATLKVGNNAAGVCPVILPPTPTRTIFMAADVVEWDFFPAGINKCTGTLTDRERTFVEHSATRIGSKYLKSLYREYTDGTFTKLKPANSSSSGPSTDSNPVNVINIPQHGYLGPTIELSVGESVLIVLKNNLEWPINIIPHGLESTACPAIQPGGSCSTIWTAGPKSAPMASDTSSIAWLYHSAVNVPQDQQAGLYGAVIVRDPLRWTPVQYDVQYVMSFSIINENKSPFLDENVEHYLTEPVDLEDPDFQESNLKHAINGFIFCDGPEFTAKPGQKVRWHLISVGSDLDLHSVTWRDYSVILESVRRFAVDLIPGLSKTVDMIAHGGKTLIQCDVADHQVAGMQAILNVQ